ncbi:receptor-interacting serine/threonine-protein kinase 1 [Trichomycterus rosablanca]|uniref:receptor-interacting serine/threonine-protein kinase 1 n=1 Tax=Trichomycterus rosablanca TaxID=2290929 RepID=UPI002F34F719
MAGTSSLHIMKPTDLIKKKPLDYGGFGEVFLCYHKTLGHVVLKTVYSGPLNHAHHEKKSLLEEGNLMNSLNHERVVKLLGVILENGVHSLVMELIPKGNLMVMLQKVVVPISIKGRIILEVLEGMVYLIKNNVIHKDLKPENILVDEKFHIKIADLGLATWQTWKSLSRRSKSRGKKSCMEESGTLCYMAPEHLKSIHTQFTEKSDVYSFGIVVWVIMTTHEPYEIASSQAQISNCVCQGDRPNESLIPDSAPTEMSSLMKKCWDQDPVKRPTFQESFAEFLPFYRQKLEGDVNKDLEGLMDTYEGPISELEENMKVLTTEPENAPAGLNAPSYPARTGDSPTPLRSTNMEPIEASLEDMNLLSTDNLQVDAVPANHATPAISLSSPPANLEQKLQQEFNYHKHGSYTAEQQNLPPHNSPGLSLPGYRCGTDLPQQVSSVQSWTKPNPVAELGLATSLSPSQEAFSRPDYGSHMSLPNSQFEPYQYQKPPIERTHSYPDNIADTRKMMYSQPETGGSLYINNSSGIQIGNNNTMHIRGLDSGSTSSQSGASSSNKYIDLLKKYGDHAVTEDHLNLVRQNLGSSWKSCARNLGLTNLDLETIEHDYERDGLNEKVHQMLMRWKMKEGFQGCTVGKLCRSLHGYVNPKVLVDLLNISNNCPAP